MDEETKGLSIGGPCFELAPGLTWEGSGNFDWLISESEERAVEELGRRRVLGIQCIVFRCADDRVRAVPMKLLEKRKG